MSFLPEEDRDLLAAKQIPYVEKEEKLPDGTARRGVMFPGFAFQANLFEVNKDGGLKACALCDVLVLIPSGYATTKLDSFYTRPHLKKSTGGDPNCATNVQKMFDMDWQFWSRHLTDEEWNKGAKDLVNYLQIVKDALRSA